MCLELAPGVTPEDAGVFTVTNTVTRVDGWTVHLVDDTVPPVGKCEMLTRAKPYGSTLLGWVHPATCELTKTRVHGVGVGKCYGGQP